MGQVIANKQSIGCKAPSAFGTWAGGLAFRRRPYKQAASRRDPAHIMRLPSR
jgi:hypothetical protein